MSERMEVCGAKSPSYSNSVPCDRPKGHEGNHRADGPRMTDGDGNCVITWYNSEPAEVSSGHVVNAGVVLPNPTPCPTCHKARCLVDAWRRVTSDTSREMLIGDVFDLFRDK